MTPEKIRRGEWKKMCRKPLKQRLTYFWDYYKWYAIVAAVLLAAVAVYVGGLLSEAEDSVYGLMLNNCNILNQQRNEQLAQDMASEFRQELGRSEKELELTLDVSHSYDPDNGYYGNYDTLQLILNYSMGGMLDFVVADEASMLDLAYAGYFRNLKDLFPEKELEQYSGQLLYVDMAVILKENESMEAGGSDYPDPRKPEDMEEPVPVFVDVSASDKIGRLYGDGKNVFFAMVGNDSRGYAHAFLNDLLGQK